MPSTTEPAVAAEPVARRRVPPPTATQVTELPAWHDLVVGPDLIDPNEHLNITHYFRLGATAIGHWYEQLGLGEDYRQRRRLSLFTAEQHLVYHAEVGAGSRLTVHPRLLRRSHQAMHAQSFLVDRSQALVVCTMEIVLVHVSLETRNPEPFPPDAARWLDDAIAAQPPIAWDPSAGCLLWRLTEGDGPGTG